MHLEAHTIHRSEATSAPSVPNDFSTYLVAFEASPFVLRALAAAGWNVSRLLYIGHGISCSWLYLLDCVLIWMAMGYLLVPLATIPRRRMSWYPISDLSRAILDVIRSCCCCFIVLVILVTLGIIDFWSTMAATLKPLDGKIKADPMSDGTFKMAFVFLSMAYGLVVLGVGVLLISLLLKDQKRLKQVMYGQAESAETA
ncbi:hypothetical protein LZ554_000545 [Drepanopeziza brunnea f. sp. 'monogermtubi']|nr:hypothetical protein LZ554_000545 [Drepanopeziza brunnea f. sp. 'monogermtubi']